MRLKTEWLDVFAGVTDMYASYVNPVLERSPEQISAWCRAVAKGAIAPIAPNVFLLYPSFEKLKF